MNKWELSFEGPALFSCELGVRISDLNYGNHLGNDRIVSLLHEARVQFLRAWNYTEMNMEGVGLILRDLSVVLKKEMFYGDLLRVELSVPEWSGTGFRMLYRIWRKEGDAEVITALAHTTMICFDYQKNKPVRVPEPILLHRFSGK
ncbi:MAG: thioesterase [Bacteroidetes bacterium]|nr:thioesterase [Bacteroidota bacterium]